MVEIIFDDYFKTEFSKIKHPEVKAQILKQLKKIKENPDVGKPMQNPRKGTREVYIGSSRLAYKYLKINNAVIVLDFYHKDEQ